MPIREIVWNVDPSLCSISPNTPQNGGVQGEHNVTRVAFNIPAGSELENEKYQLYIYHVNAAGSYDKTEPLTIENGQVSCLLPRQWTQYGGMSRVSLVAEADGETAYTLEGKVTFHSRQTATAEEKRLLEGFMQQQCDAAAASAEEAAVCVAQAAGHSDTAYAQAQSAIAAEAMATARAEAAKQSAADAAYESEDARRAMGAAEDAAERAAQVATKAEAAADNAAQYLSSVKSDAQSAAASAAQAAADAKTVSNGISAAQSAASTAGQAAGAASAARSDAQNHAANASAAKNAAETGAAIATQAAADAQSAAERAEKAAEHLEVDDNLDPTSTNPVANSAVTGAIAEVDAKIEGSGGTFVQNGNINNTGIELGSIVAATGAEVAHTTITRCDDYIPVFGGETIYAIFENTTFNGTAIKSLEVYTYDKDKVIITVASASRILYGKNMVGAGSTLVTEFTLPEDCAYIRFRMTSSGSVDYKVGFYYSYYTATTVEEYAPPVLVGGDGINARLSAVEADVADLKENGGGTGGGVTIDALPEDEHYIVPEYEYNVRMIDALRKQIAYLQDYVSTLHAPTVLDSGVCGENLTWALYSDGLLKISGTGRSYDYCKGILIGKTRAEIEQYCAETGHTEYGFQEGKTYDDAHEQYVSPWYKYRDEVSFTENGGNYCTKASYDSENPNGWKYNRIEVDKGVTYFGDWLFYRVSGPTEFVVPDSVTELGDWAIRYSPTLKCIHLPDNITTVGYRGCSRNEVATAIRLPSGLATVGEYAFAQNSMVKYLSVQGNADTTFGERIFNGNFDLEYISFKDVTEVGKYACVECPSLAKVDLPDTLTAIRYGAFFKTACLTSVRVPPLVDTIETNAFYQCTGLKTVYIDSPTISAGLIYASGSGYGGLVGNAKYIYVKNDITTLGKFFTDGCTRVADVDGYVLYIKNE